MTRLIGPPSERTIGTERNVTVERKLDHECVIIVTSLSKIRIGSACFNVVCPREESRETFKHVLVRLPCIRYKIRTRQNIRQLRFRLSDLVARLINDFLPGYRDGCLRVALQPAYQFRDIIGTDFIVVLQQYKVLP